MVNVLESETKVLTFAVRDLARSCDAELDGRFVRQRSAGGDSDIGATPQERGTKVADGKLGGDGEEKQSGRYRRRVEQAITKGTIQAEFGSLAGGSAAALKRNGTSCEKRLKGQG